MIGALRVSLAPIPGPAGGRLTAVSGARIGLTRLGKGKTLATTSPQPAQLELKLVLLKTVRPEPTTEERELPTLSGTLALGELDRAPLFTLDPPGGEPAGSDDDTASGARAKDPRRFLHLEFDDATFLAEKPVRVPLPEDIASFPHAEVHVRLTIGGAEEASFEANDVLDKPVVFPRARVRPARYLNTPVDGDTGHNLSFALKLPEGERFARLFLQDAELVDGEDSFTHEDEVFFRPPGKPEGTLKGLLVTESDLAFDFELEPTAGLNDHMSSLSVQVANARQFASVAADRAASKGKEPNSVQTLNSVLLSEFLTAMVRILDGIEGTLSGNHEFGLFQALSAELPVLQAEADEGHS